MLGVLLLYLPLLIFFFTYCIGMIYSIGNAYFSPLDLKQKSSCRFCFRWHYLYLWAQRQYSNLAYSDLQSRVHIVLRGKGERFLCLVCFRKHSISTWKKQNQKTFLQPWGQKMLCFAHGISAHNGTRLRNKVLFASTKESPNNRYSYRFVCLTSFGSSMSIKHIRYKKNDAGMDNVCIFQYHPF